jgi:aldehyde:ferredoxin oxidoreductase
MFGYAGKILHVDLSQGKSSVEEIDDAFCMKYIGGNGFGIRLLCDHAPPGVDPFSPENPLIFAIGPFAGTTTPTSGKYIVHTKSPLTGFQGEAVSSGFWAPALKQAGYDAVVIKGRSAKPLYLFIDDGTIQFRDAKSLWGKDALETLDLIREEIGDDNVRSASIGPGGENLVRYANITNDRHRQAGRTGVGAVMGSKNLKAVTVRGTGSVKVADMEGTLEHCKELYEVCQSPLTGAYRTLGTQVSVMIHQNQAALPTRNWQDSVFEFAEKIGGEYIHPRWVVKTLACAGCPIGCDHVTLVKEGEAGDVLASVEFESLYALGSNCSIGHFPDVNKAVDLCDRMGIDTISAGVTISWAMECFEKGVLTKKDTDGLDLTFGNSEAQLEAIELIAHQKGNLGKLLASGTKAASEQIGKGSEKWAMHNKGLEYPGYDLRGLKMSALGFNTSTRGGCHLRNSSYDFDLKGKVDRFEAKEEYGKLVMDRDDMWSIVDSLILCKFSRGVLDSYEKFVKLYNLVTGLGMTVEGMRLAGERIWNLEKAFNVREGWTERDDYPAPRIMEDPITEGVAKGCLVTEEEFRMMHKAYFRERGWSSEGIPTKVKLLELGLDGIAEEIGAEAT